MQGLVVRQMDDSWYFFPRFGFQDPIVEKQIAARTFTDHGSASSYMWEGNNDQSNGQHLSKLPWWQFSLGFIH